MIEVFKAALEKWLLFPHPKIPAYSKEHALLQDAANVTLRSETLRRNCVRCNNRKWWCKNRQKGAKRLR